MRRSLVIAASLAQKPHQGGHTWVLLQYLLGFRRLGWDVTFLDRLEPPMYASPGGVENIAYCRKTLADFAFDNDFSIACDGGTRWIGLDRSALLNRAGDAELFINVMGFITDPAILSAARRKVFLDIDPGFGQMWRELRQADLFAGHDQFVTIGENIGRNDCTIPTCGLDWITTKQPIMLEHWPAQQGEGSGHFTGIGAWRGPYAPIEFNGRRYGLRCHEFRKFADLPRRTGGSFEIALDIHDADQSDRELLQNNGWRIVDPRSVAGDTQAYQRYLGQSLGEFMIAKNLYVQSNSGWFSDRSICYLASGRPVVAQDTGLSQLLPLGRGLLTFTTPDEAADAVEGVRRDHAMHSRAARAIAEEVFDSDKVLRRLLDKLSI